MVPSILVVGADKDALIHVVQGVRTKLENSTVGDLVLQIPTTCVEARLETKYYGMDLKFCVHVGRKLGVEVDLTELDETVGLIYVCDEIEESIIKDIEEWEGAVMKGSLVFRLIVPSKGNSGNEAVDDWCFDNQAEIIELTREVEEDDDDEFVDKFGIDRIVEVMESNLWEVAQRKPLKAEDQELEAAAQLGIELDPVGADFMKNFRKVMKQDGMFDLETTINQLQQIRSYGETLPEDKRKDLAAFVSLMVANEIE